MSAHPAKDATAESSRPPARQASKPDLLTIAAIAIVATVIANFIHEGLGHGGMCVATGGQPLVFSTVHFECSADTRLVAAGGTLANLIFGALSWVAMRAVTPSAPWRYFFWLLMTLNLFGAGGYFLFSGIGNIGDWAAVVAGWQSAWAWRVGLAALGIVTYFFLFVPLSVRELRLFLGKDANIRVRRARQLTLVPYLTVGVLSCAAGALNPVGRALDSDLRRGCVLRWQLRAGVDVGPAVSPPLPQQRIPDARNSTQSGMDPRCSRPGDRIRPGTRTRTEVSFCLAGVMASHPVPPSLANPASFRRPIPVESSVGIDPAKRGDRSSSWHGW